MRHGDDVQQAAERVRLELVTRKLGIMILGLTVLWVGLAMVLTGAPNFIEGWFSPWSRYMVGGVAVLAGAGIVAGDAWGDQTARGYWSQCVGLGLMTLWNLFMAVTYGVYVLLTGLEIVGPGEPLSAASTGRGYVPVLYAGLAVLTAVPMGTMIRLGRPSRRLGA